MTINNLEIPLNATIRQEYVKCGNPHVVHISTAFATANDKAMFNTTLVILIQRMSSGHKLSTEEERTEILLDHIAKNTRLDGKLCNDVTRPTVTAIRSFTASRYHKHKIG